jgi:signal transduction histidine kinase/PAS domain-containing protein
VKPSATVLGDTGDVLHRVGRAADLRDAGHALIDTVVVARGGSRAVLLAVENGVTRPVASVGWTADQLDGLRFQLDEAAGEPLTQALSSCEVRIVETVAGQRQPARTAIVPVASGRADRPFGALLIGLDAVTEADLADISAIGRLVGPLLARQQEVEELRASYSKMEREHHLLLTMVNGLPDPVLITDAENNIIIENGRAEALFSTSPEDSEGRRRAIEINNLLFSSFLTRSTIGGADPNGRELNLVDPSEGGDLLFEVLSTPAPATIAGEGTTVSVLRNVTDLKKASTELEHQFKRVRHAEQKARRERDRLNLVLENVGDPILVTDDQANIILMNREAERLFDVPPGTSLKSRHRLDVRANDTKFSSFVSDLALSSDIARTGHMQLHDPVSSREFPAEVVSGKVINERSEMTAIVSVVHDLTKVVENERLAEELRQLNEELEDRIRAAIEELAERNRQLEWQQSELERAYRLKSQFLASMSHELRTPINALLGYTSLMQDRIYGELTTRQEEALDRMYAASQHLLELVNDVLDLAKIEAGKMPVHVERIDLQLLLRELSQTIEPMLRVKNLSFEMELESALPDLITDRTKVKQIFLNLLSNAVKFTHEGGVTVLVRPLPNQAGVEVRIKDTGIGMQQSDIPKIFEDFRQVDQSSTREYGGTGLGLSITKKLLVLLGGSIEVESQPAKGSTFTVRFPLRSEEIVLSGLPDTD